MTSAGLDETTDLDQSASVLPMLKIYCPGLIMLTC